MKLLILDMCAYPLLVLQSRGLKLLGEKNMGARLLINIIPLNVQVVTNLCTINAPTHAITQHLIHSSTRNVKKQIYENNFHEASNM